MPSKYKETAAAGMMPDPRMNLIEWANERFSLPKESTAEYGRFRSSRTPFIEEILETLSPDNPAETVVCVKPTQLGGTTIALIFLLGTIDLYPGPAMMLLPTDAMARSFSKKRLMPAIRLVDTLREKVKEPKSRDSKNTILTKVYPGGNLLLSGSNASASFRSESVKFLILDDFDNFSLNIEGEGSPEELADRRTGSFPGRKIYINSTTTIAGQSNIELAFEKTSQGYFHCPCPYCGHYQYLEFGGLGIHHGIKFTRDDKGQVTDCWYECACCHQKITEDEKPWMIENGKYIHRFPDRPSKGFRYNAFVTPLGWVNTWRYITSKFLEAKKAMDAGNHEKMIVWMNSFAAEPFEIRGSRTPEEIRRLVDNLPAGRVPSSGVLGLVMGADTQANGIYYVIRAFGRDRESWLIKHGFVDDFSTLDRLITESEYLDDAGNRYAIQAVFIDSGGHRTAEVYDFCRGRNGIFPSKGEREMPTLYKRTKIYTMPGTDIIIRGALDLVHVNTTHFKFLIASKLQVNPFDPGAFHIHAETTDDYFSQMSVEYVDKKGFWACPPNRANHYWDCEVYAFCAAEMANLCVLSAPIGMTAAETKTEPVPPQLAREARMREQRELNRQIKREPWPDERRFKSSRNRKRW